MDLKVYQALASQLEQIASILIEDHSDRVRFRNEVLRKLAELEPTSRPNGQSDTFLTTKQASTIWSVVKVVGPWVLAAGVSLFHLISHIHHY